eukprot:10495673-Alexandrium_andersonii.AAC.1
MPSEPLPPETSGANAPETEAKNAEMGPRGGFIKALLMCKSADDEAAVKEDKEHDGWSVDMQ